MINEYRDDKQVADVVGVLLYEVALSLRHFQRLVGKCNSGQITHSVIDKFIFYRGKEVKRTTLKVDIKSLMPGLVIGIIAVIAIGVACR